MAALNAQHADCASEKQYIQMNLKSTKSSPVYQSSSLRLRLAADVHRYSTSDDDSGCVMEEYTWVPSGLMPEIVHLYFSCLPGEKVPYINSVGEKWRMRQLQYQLPPQDSDARYCGNLTEVEENELRIIEETRKRECLGRGVISKIPFDHPHKTCHQCKSSILPDEIVVGAPDRFSEDYVWHPQCFVCFDCNELLIDLIYYKHNENVFCGRHHAEQIKPRCAHCDELIFCEECTEAEGRVWHLKHFICTRCDCQLGGKRYIVRNELPYCIPCYHLAVELRCNTCHKDIIADKPHITQANIHWHADERCFCCVVCEKNLLGKRYCFVDNQLLCGVNICARIQEQEQKKKFIFQRAGSLSSVPPASSSPSLISLTPSDSASPAHSDRPSSAKQFSQNTGFPVQKSPSRVRFDLRPQHLQIQRQTRPKPPKRNPPPPPANIPVDSAMTPPENIYETVVMPSQLSSASSQDLNQQTNSKRNRRKLKKKFNNNNHPEQSVNYLPSLSHSSSEDDEIACSSASLRKQKEICASPARSKSADGRDFKKNPQQSKYKNDSKHNHYTRGPPESYASSSSSTSSDSDDAYVTEYLAKSLSRLQYAEKMSNPNKSFYKKGQQQATITTPRTAKNKKSSNSNCIVS